MTPADIIKLISAVERAHGLYMSWKAAQADIDAALAAGGYTRSQIDEILSDTRSEIERGLAAHD